MDQVPEQHVKTLVAGERLVDIVLDLGDGLAHDVEVDLVLFGIYVADQVVVSGEHRDDGRALGYGVPLACAQHFYAEHERDQKTSNQQKITVHIEHVWNITKKYAFWHGIRRKNRLFYLIFTQFRHFLAKPT
jgi:hypothetical protein